MSELEELKTIIESLNKRISVLETNNMEVISEMKAKNNQSSQEKLVSKYRRCIFLEAFFMIVFDLFLMFDPEVNDKYLWPTLIYWTCFFIIEIIIDYYLMINVDMIDIYGSSLRDVAKQAARCWKIHKLAIFFNIPLAIGAVILFGFAMNADKFMVFGMICGGIGGLLIGLRLLRKFIYEYKQLQIIDD